MGIGDLKSLTNFLRGARGLSQERIIVTFLSVVTDDEELVDNGSVLINHPQREKLVLFNADDFLFEKKLLDPSQRLKWPTEFGWFEGIAGRCFRESRTLLYSKSDSSIRADFFGQSPIENMVCIPIVTGPGNPLGVVCFHNNVSTKKFLPETIAALESYVDILALALHVPHPELQLEQNIFIVHGRDVESRKSLENILLRYGLTPKVLKNEHKNAQSILHSIEDLLRICKHGFIIVTPDDEGRLRKPGEELRPRTRENVIFETGLLFAKFRGLGRDSRVAILLKEPAQLPSDLKGIFYDAFDSIDNIESRIKSQLENWGLKPKLQID
jgi:predicted nucleotide-binding protein